MSAAVSAPSSWRWTRRAPLTGVPDEVRPEQWECRDDSGLLASLEVNVRIGKRLDVVGLKNASLQEVHDYADFLQQTADRLYAPGRPLRTVAHCPCCERDSQDATMAFQAFGISYHRCVSCGHAFVRQQPDSAALEDSFTESEERAAAYTDRESLELRMSQIIAPKVDWSLQVARSAGVRVRRALDVGAGGGHFVEGLRRAGLEATGYELSRASRRFAREVFNLELRDGDFLSAAGEAFDLITFWGLLEYTPDPLAFLRAAHRALSAGNGLLVLEVPRFDCLGTAAQAIPGAVVARHLDPTSHVNTFSDASLATCLTRAGFRPVAAWYFGMDAYEMLVQASLRLGLDTLPEGLASMVPALQERLDQGLAWDDLVVAAVPLPEVPGAPG